MLLLSDYCKKSMYNFISNIINNASIVFLFSVFFSAYSFVASLLILSDTPPERAGLPAQLAI